MALEYVKTKLTKDESVNLVLEDEEAKKVLSAWRVLPLTVKDFNVRDTVDPVAVLATLWAHASVNIAELSKLSTIPETRAKTIFERLRAAYLIWPDGTITDLGIKLLNADRTAYLNSRIPKWRK